jgi:hypothetical protein
MLLLLETENTGCVFALGYIIHYTQFGSSKTALGKNPFYYYDATPPVEDKREENSEKCDAEVENSRDY